MGDHRLSEDIMYKLRYEPFTRKKMTRGRYKIEIETAERLGAYDIFLGEDSSKFYTAKSMFNDMVKGMPANEMSKMVQSLEVPINYWEYYHKVPSNLDISKLDTTEWDAGYVLYHLLSYVRDKELISPTDLEMRLQLAKMHGNYDVYGYETGKITEKQLIIYAAQEFREREMKDHHKNVTTWRMTVFTSSWQLLRMLADNMSPDQYNMMINTMVVPRNFRLYNFGEPYSELPKSKRYGVNIFTLTAALIYLVTTGRLKPIVESKSELPPVTTVEIPQHVKAKPAAVAAVPLLGALFTSYKGIKYPFPRDDLTPSYPQTIDTFMKSHQYSMCLRRLAMGYYDWSPLFKKLGNVGHVQSRMNTPLPYANGYVYHKLDIKVTVLDSLKKLILYIGHYVDGWIPIAKFGKVDIGKTKEETLRDRVNNDAKAKNFIVKYLDDFTLDSIFEHLMTRKGRWPEPLPPEVSRNTPKEMIANYGIKNCMFLSSEYNTYIDIDEIVKKGIRSNKMYDIIVFGFHDVIEIDYYDVNLDVSLNDNSIGHVNSTIIDYKNKHVIYFEPHGYVSGYHPTDESGLGYKLAPVYIMKAYFEQAGWTFTIGIAGVQKEDGLCQTWAVLLPIMYIINPDIDMIQLYQHIQSGKFRYTIAIAFLYYVCKSIPYEANLRHRGADLSTYHSEVTTAGDLIELKEIVDTLNGKKP